MHVPPEILYDIVGTVVVDFIDAKIPDQVVLRRRLSQTEDGTQGQAPPDGADAGKAVEIDNPIVPLLYTSSLIRETTLIVLSDAFGIPRSGDGRLALPPSSRLQAVIDLYRLPSPGDFNEDTVNKVISWSPLMACYARLLAAELRLRHLIRAPGEVDSAKIAIDIARSTQSSIPQFILRRNVKRRHIDMCIYIALAVKINLSHNVWGTFESIAKICIQLEGLMAAHDVAREQGRDLRDCAAAILAPFLGVLELIPASVKDLKHEFFVNLDFHADAAAQTLDFAVVEKVLAAIVEYPGDCSPKFEECRERARSILGQWPPEL